VPDGVLERQPLGEVDGKARRVEETPGKHQPEHGTRHVRKHRAPSQGADPTHGEVEAEREPFQPLRREHAQTCAGERGPPKAGKEVTARPPERTTNGVNVPAILV
jgi:hypothetical protein